MEEYGVRDLIGAMATMIIGAGVMWMWLAMV